MLSKLSQFRLALLLVCLAYFPVLAQSQDAIAQARGLFREGYELLQQRRLDESIVKFESGLRLDSTSSAAAMAHSYLADIYFNRNDDASASSHFQEVIRLAPQSEQAATARTRMAALMRSPQPMAATKPSSPPQEQGRIGTTQPSVPAQWGHLQPCPVSDSTRIWTNCYGVGAVSEGMYQGEWQDGRPNGKGMISFPKGGFVSGQFREGRRYGVMFVKEKDGSWHSETETSGVSGTPSF